MTLDFWEQLRSSLWEDLPRIIVLLNVSNSFNLGLFTITYVKANYQTNKSPKKRNSEHTLNKNTSHSSLWSLSSFPDCRDITYTHTNKWTHTGYCLFKKQKQYQRQPTDEWNMLPAARSCFLCNLTICVLKEIPSAAHSLEMASCFL